MEEKFRKKLLIASRVIALLLVLAIFFIGFVQINYAKEFNELRRQHGNNAFCYMCGLESARTCSCNYEIQTIAESPEFNRQSYLEMIATRNIEKCEDRNGELELPNLTL